MHNAPLRHVLRLGTNVPTTVDVERRTLRAVAATSDPVRDFGVMPNGSYGYWYHKLDMAGADLSRFVGGPVLRDHAATTRDTVGVIDAARIEGGKLLADIRLSSRDDVTSLLTDVSDGILRGVSIAFNGQQYAPAGEHHGVPLFTVTRWSPFELSFTPTPADAGATVQTRCKMTDDPVQNDVVPADGTSPVDIQERTGVARRIKRAAAEAVQIAEDDDAPPPKQAAIRQVFAMAGLSADAADNAIAARLTPPQVRDAVYQHLQYRGAAQPMIDTRKPAQDHPDADLEDALLAKLRGSGGSGWRLADVARATLSRQGLLVSGQSDAAVFSAVHRQRFASGAILGAHTTSDFPQLLGSSVGRYLREQYMLAASPLKTVSVQRDRSDFRAGSSIVLGEPPALLEVGEAGMVTHGTIGEASASWSVRTFARIFSISRQALINDDLGGFSRALSGWAVAAAACEADLLFALISGAGATVAETGLSLWHSSHGNLASSGAALSVSTLGDAVEALRTQRSVADGHFLALQPRFLLVGPATELAARQLLVDVAGVQRTDIQPFGGLEVLVEPRITDGAWHLFAAPGPHSPLEYGYLSGAEGVQVTSEDGFETLGTKYRAVLDFGCGVVDYRGAYKNAGA